MSDQNEERCGTCRFATISKQDINECVCRRNPPQVFTALQRLPDGSPAPLHLNTQPLISTRDWCGEWQPRKQIVT